MTELNSSSAMAITIRRHSSTATHGQPPSNRLSGTHHIDKWARCLPPSPPAEKATASKDKTWKASTGDGARDNGIKGGDGQKVWHRVGCATRYESFANSDESPR